MQLNRSRANHGAPTSHKHRARKSTRFSSIASIFDPNKKPAISKLNERMASLSVAGFTLLLFLVSTVSAAVNETRYVDNTATGPSTGTQANPYRTIQEAVLQAENGDTIVVLGTTQGNPRLYPERVDFRNARGAENVRLTVSPRRSVLMYGFMTGGSGDGLTIERFQVTIPQNLFHELDGRMAIYMDSDYITVRDNYVFETPGWAIRSADAMPVGGHVVGNRVYRCGSGIVITGHDWLIEDNEVERTVWYPIAGGVDADYSRGFGSNITFRHNHFHGSLASETGTSHVDGFQFFDHNGFSLDNFVFENNIVSECGQGVIITSRNRASDNIIIRGNVFEGNMGTGAYTTSTAILVRGHITNFEATHNLVSNVRYHGINTNEGMEALVQNNILYNAGTNYRASADATLVGGYNLINVPSNRSNQDPNDLNGYNPMLLDPGNWLGADGLPFTADDGARLLPGSPAIDAGANATDLEDMFGTARPQDGHFDIGPHEVDTSTPDPLEDTWVDFAYEGNEHGTEVNPYDTLTESLVAASMTETGVVKIKGDTESSVSMEAIRITQPVTLVAVNGTVRIGPPPAAFSGAGAGSARLSGFVSGD